MNEIERIDSEVLPASAGSVLAPPTANIAQSRADQLAALKSEAEFLEIAFGLAEKACSGALVASHFRGKPADGAIAIAYGASLGWHWTKALQDVYVVNGKPSIMAKEMRELMIRAGHEIWEEEVGPTKVVLAGRRRGSDIVVRVEWTIEKAEKAGYTKSNPNYGKIPESMLYARCTTDLAKRLAPDALSGLGIVEDLQDQTTHATSERVAPKQRGVAGARAALGIASNQGAKPDTGQASEPATAEKAPPAATAADLKRLDAALTEAGITDMGERRTFLSARAGRELKAARELTRDEVASIIQFVKTGEERVSGGGEQS